MKLLMALVTLASLTASSQARDVPRLATGTAALSGTVVVDEPNGQPIRRALVTIVLNNDLRQQYQTSTDERGRFTIGGLPPGNARVVASRPSYVTTTYGAKQPGSNVGVPIALTNGQTADVTLRVPRGSVIAGTVTDENGQPMPGIGVRVQRVTVSALGKRTFSSSTGVFIPSTDDRGAFRVFGLAAGEYVVSAQPRLTIGAEVRPTTAAELRWAEAQVRGSGGTSANPAPAPAANQPVTYASVYFPGTVKVADAGLVSLAAGQERSSIDLRMQFVPTSRLEGVVVTQAGQPASGIQVSLLPKDDSGIDSTDAARQASLMELGLAGGTMARSDSTGAFSIAGVEPGAYTVLARTALTGRAGGAPAAGSSATLWAMTDVDVAGKDLTGLSLRLAPGQTVSGRFAFEGRTAVATPARVTVSLRAVDATGFSTSVQIALAAAGEPFEMPGMIPASYRISASVVGWTLKAVTVGGRDVTDAPLAIKPGEDLSGVVVTFTDAPAEIGGTLYDAAGRSTADLSIVLFSTDRTMWFAGSRFVRPAVRPASDGRFIFSGLGPGEYFMAALSDVSPADLLSPQFLEQVAPSAFKISVTAGEKKVQDIKVAK